MQKHTYMYVYVYMIEIKIQCIGIYNQKFNIRKLYIFFNIWRKLCFRSVSPQNEGIRSQDGTEDGTEGGIIRA